MGAGERGFEDLLDMAADAFRQRLPAQLPAQRRVPRSLGLNAAQAMLPIPPPVSVADIPDQTKTAEQSAGKPFNPGPTAYNPQICTFLSSVRTRASDSPLTSRGIQ